MIFKSDLHYISTSLMYKFAKRNSYRRKPKSYKKYGSSKRFSRRKNYSSTGSTSRVFHTV
jgi:hypothetical protein